MLLVFAIILVLIFSARAIASFYTDFLWFDSIDQTSVWSTILVSRIVIALIAIGVFFALIFASLYIADRLSPKTRPPGPEEEVLRRWHDTAGKRKGLIRTIVALFFALVTGAGASGLWQEWILITNRQSFGIKDPQFNTDIGFYVFELPFWSSVVDWLFTAILVIFFVTAVYHYINGGIRFQTKGQRVSPAVKAHLSVILGVLALVRAAGYFLDRYDLVTSSNGVVDGASYTDVNARLPVLYLLMVIAVLAAGLFIYNIWRKGWVLPIIAVGLWAFVAIVMQNIYPLIIQRFQVQPSESSREETLMERNIEFTRIALGLDNVETQEFPTGQPLSLEGLRSSSDNIDVMPLQDPQVVQQTFEQREGERGYFMFPTPLDVDRYEIDGERVPVVLGARQLDPNADQVTSGWEAERLTYTHGYGVALAPSNTVVEGFPDFAISGFSTGTEDIPLTEPRVYFAENMDGYAIVNTDRAEVDGGEGESAQQDEGSYFYTGDGGVKMGGTFRQLMFAARFWDLDPLLSGFVKEDSRVLYVRDVRERVEKLAPFLKFDSDPYMVIDEGRVKYLIDAYTTTDRYPFSQRADTEQLPADSGLRDDFNYVRNSILAVVDSFDGSVTLYKAPSELVNDPIADAYEQAFPNLFTDISEMSENLLDHIRYPVDLFRVQTNMWSRYHLTDPQEFYEQAESWAVAQDPGGVTGTQVTAVVSEDGTEITRRERRIDPYRTLLRLPGEDDLKYVILRPYVPISAEDTRRELAAFMVAVGDCGGSTSDECDDYGRLLVYTTPSGDIDGPALVNSKIQSDPGIAQRITLLDQQGSRVDFGDMLLVPVDQSILYVRPLYVIAESTQVPELQQVIVVLDESVVMCPRLDQALDALFGLQPVATQVGTTDASNCVGTVEDASVVMPVGGTTGVSPEPEPEDPDEAETDEAETGGTAPTSTTAPPTTGPPTTAPETGDPETGTRTDAELIREANEAFQAAQDALDRGDLGAYQENFERAGRLIAELANR